jgi:MinD-like ATPase involved in chromosome partitioning or flagellar assembly
VSSDKLVPRSVNEGDPIVSLYPRSRPAKDLRAVAALVLDGEAIDEQVVEEKRGWFK